MFSVISFVREPWTKKNTDKEKILTYEMYCNMKIFQISWSQKVINMEITTLKFKRILNSENNNDKETEII